MQIVTSVHAADVPPNQLAAILAEYCALEQLRDVRRAFVPQLGILLVAAVLLWAIGVTSAMESTAVIAVLLAAILWIWVLEFYRDRQFMRHLTNVPGIVTASSSREKVIKNP